MKPALALLAVGAIATILQGVVATFVPPRFAPDLGLLLVLGLGLCWRSTAGGLLLAALLGYLTDLLSGALLGQHAVVRLLVFLSARLGSRQLNLRGVLPLAVFTAVLTAGNALALAALSDFFCPGAGPDRALLLELLPQALVNAVFAWPVAALTAWIANRLGDLEGGRRVLRLETRGGAA